MIEETAVTHRNSCCCQSSICSAAHTFPQILRASI